jgi:hypothetical protein
MHHSLAERLARRFGSWALCALLAISSLACATRNPTATVELSSLDGKARLTQKFEQVFFSRAAGGDYDIVLVQQADPSASVKSGKSGWMGWFGGKDKDDAAPVLDAATASPLTHVFHVRVLWRPARAIRPDSPTATNAAVTWSVIADDGSGRVDYSGAGFVNVYGRADQVRVMLRGVTLAPTSRMGALEDPVGRAAVESDFKARRNDDAVRTGLAMTREAPDRAAAVAHSGAPAPVIGTPVPTYPGPPPRQPAP